MRRIFPVAVEEVLEVYGVAGLQYPFPIVWMDHRLRAGEKSGADPGRAGAEGEHRSEAATPGDPAGCDHWCRRHCVDHRGHQRQRSDRSPDMATGLPSLPTTTSTPQSTARLASATEPTECNTAAPPAFAREIRGRDRARRTRSPGRVPRGTPRGAPAEGGPVSGGRRRGAR